MNQNTNIKNPIHVLSIGIDRSLIEQMKASLNVCAVSELSYDLEKLMDPLTPAPQLVLCGLPPSEISLIEIAQMLRMQYAQSPIYLITSSRAGFDRKNFQKNGFTDAFLLPLDWDHLKQTISEFISKESKGAVKAYRPVKILDIQPGETLDFDTTIYLPANNKYIRYSTAGDTLDEERIKKLTQHKMSTVYVTLDQMDSFYKYTADKLRKLGLSSGMSATERKEKLSGSIRELMTGIFNDTSKEATFEQGQTLLTDCRNIVNNYIFETPSGDWYKRLLNAMGEKGSNYSHSANVSTYAALFSIGLGIGDPADLATAGLLHDIGLADIPEEILNKPETERTRDGQALYQKHPELSVNILKARKLVLPEKVTKAILQHHELYNGTGYPNGHIGSKICKEAQILALADKFDEMTSAAEGRPLMTPNEAIKYFKDQVIDDPGKMIFEPNLLKGILKLFPTDESGKDRDEHRKAS